jgi:hypothetical protein
MVSLIECRVEGYGSAIVEPAIRLGMTTSPNQWGSSPAGLNDLCACFAHLRRAQPMLVIRLRIDRDIRRRCSRLGRTSRLEHCVEPLVAHRHQW